MSNKLLDRYSGAVDHNNLINTHNLTTDIDHNSISNTHNLTDEAGEYRLQSKVTTASGVFTGQATNFNVDDNYE